MTQTGDGPRLWLPSGGPEPLPSGTALAALRGYALGRRPLRFRSPGLPEGRWVEVPAFGWSRFDARPVEPLGEAGALRSGSVPFWDLGDDELSVLGEPGTVGALLRTIREDAGPCAGPVLAALHHRHPDLVPHLTPTTRRALLPHTEEGDSGVEAVVHRELRANAEAFAALEDGVGAETGVRVTRLRLHDILLWLRTTLRFTHAVALGAGEREPAANTRG